MINLFYRIIPKRIKSGTFKYSTPVDVFNCLINDVMADKAELDKVRFSTKKCKGWAEVYLEGGNIIVDFWFPFEDNLDEVFERKGIRKPIEWSDGAYKAKKKARFRLSGSRKDSIAPFLDLVFRKLYGCSDSYILCGKMILGLWQMTG